jgi:hypothetical protein
MSEPAQPTSGDANWRVIMQAIRVVSAREQVNVSEARASLRAEAEAFRHPLGAFRTDPLLTLGVKPITM